MKAVVFDMDGTLLDTEKYNVRFWMAAGRNMGFPITEDDVLYIRSLDPRLSEKYFKGRFGDSFDFNTVREERRRLMREHVAAEGVEVKEGVQDVLSFLRSSGLKLAVATATAPERANKYLADTGLDGFFDRIICTSSVKNGKPAPDVYLHVCSVLGCDPGDCLAVEDAPHGIRSAFDAGCRVVMIRDLTAADDSVRGMIEYEAVDMHDLRDYFSKLLS